MSSQKEKAVKTSIHGIWSLARFVVAAVWLGLVIPLSAVGQAPPPQQLPTAVDFVVNCVKVKDLSVFERFNTSASEAATGVKPDTQADCLTDPPGKGGLLVGAGDLQVSVDDATFEAAMQERKGKTGTLVLFLNGVSMGSDAKFLGGEKLEKKDAEKAEKDKKRWVSVLRFRIAPGKQSQALWSQLYADGGLTSERALHVGLGWREEGNPNVITLPLRAEAASATVSITTGWNLTFALAAIAAVVGVLIYMGATSELMRDAVLPQFWKDAVAAYEIGANPTARLTELATHAAYTANANNVIGVIAGGVKPAPRFAALAAAALAKQPVLAADEVDTAIGLMLEEKPWKPVRASFSFTQVQLALWFGFAVATGLFLWVLYGDLPKIDNSVLTLLGLSLGTSGLSWMADRSVRGTRPYQPTQGFWLDMTTGWTDDKMQVYRYQAVVVNLLLLVVGVVHVAQQLTYPTFDSTWLIFLGVSSGTFGIGKQMKET
jgi:hypothetical protein